MLKFQRLWRGLAVVFIIILSFAIVAAVVFEDNRAAIDNLTGSRSEVIESDTGSGKMYTAFTPPEEVLNKDGSGNSKALIGKFVEFGRRLAAEGSVLLKNENNVLPLAAGSKVTLLGQRSHVPIMGSALGQPIKGPVITLEDALSGTATDFANPNKNASGKTASTISNFNFSEVGGAGAGFELNQTMISVYDAITSANSDITYVGPASRGNFSSTRLKYDPQEPSLAQLAEQDADYEDSFANYSDAAIVVVGRPSSENNDYLPGNVADGIGAKEPLELVTNEMDIINKAKANFDKVIVLVNTTSPMELGELADDEQIDSILWVGHMGNYGCLGIADILSGKVSPSGGLADIYVDKNLSHPAMMNMGDYTVANADAITRRSGSKYVMEPENIYVGYRYYETRYNDIIEGRGNADSKAGAKASANNWRYNEEVTYPFGYGLSYTTFTQEFVGEPVIMHEGNEFYAEFTVKVTNTGDTPGKSIVQIYGQAPYKENGVEKSAVQLLAYDKTETLAAADPDSSKDEQTLKITVDMQNIASWDSAHENTDGTKGTYILDVGDYYFALGNGSHEAMNNILSMQGHTPANTGNKMDAEGNADLVFEYSYNNGGKNEQDDVTFALSKSGGSVSNKLEYADWNYYEEGKVTQLSRSDWNGTYPIEYANLVAPKSMIGDLNGKYYEVKTGDNTSGITFGSTATALNFVDLKDLNYDDERWDQLVSQMSIKDCMNVIAAGGNNFRNISSVGFIGGMYTENSGNGVAIALINNNAKKAPWAIPASDGNVRYELEVFATAPLVASSFDPALHYEMGEIVGLQALFVGLPILWGPGMNTHRHPYNGRSGDYYSEDPVLTGYVGMEFAMGALEYGLIASPKHFAFNDQETNRGGIAPFMTEQRAREIELRAFQIPIEATEYDTEEKDVGMLGLMTSFSKIGGVECTASYGLMTGILRNEWGFHGYAVTDIGDDMDLFAAVVAAGTTGYDVRSDFTTSGFDKYQNAADNVTPAPEIYSKDAHILTQLKTAAKNVLYVFCQSNLMNVINTSSKSVWNMTWYRALYIALIAVGGALFAASVALYALSSFKKKKEAI